MDVRRKLCGLLFVASVAVSACSGKKSENVNNNNNKTGSSDCVDLAVKNENIVRWKNGKISRLVFRSSEARKIYLKKYNKQISAVEDNFQIPKPKPMNFQLLGYLGDINWGMKTINAAPLWANNILGQDIVVAIIDSGMDTHHSQLQNRLHTNPNEIPNGIDDDNNGLIDDIHGYDFVSKSGDIWDDSGHGTHIAGIIAADHSAGDVTGIAPQAKLLIYDFFGGRNDGTVFDAIRSIRAAAQTGAKVINASWGGPGCSSALKAEIDSLKQKDVLFITAAGNESTNIDYSPSYPAAFNASTQITVGAMTVDEYTAGFSNYGNRVDIVAPGTNIYSTFPGDQYTNMDGTSMATPFVTGAAALLWSAFPKASAADIKNAILASSRAGYYPVKTHGALDVNAAYEILNQQFAATLK